MDFNGFKREYKLVRASLRVGETSDVEAAQRQLRDLASRLEPDADRKVAEKLIDGLPATVAATHEPPAEPSPEMLEARRIIDEGKFTEGTREERLAAFDEARNKIWAIADRAGADSNQIRYLTRRFESTERYLEEGYPWEPGPDSPGA